MHKIFIQKAIKLTPVSDSDNYSSFGGKAFVQDDFVWPVNSDGVPLNLIAQIDLEKSSSFLQSFYLPKKGNLLFFYDLVNMPWQGDNSGVNGWKVIYQEKPIQYVENLKTRKNLKFKKIQFSVMDTYKLEDGADEEAEENFYSEYYEKNDVHHIGGFPYAVQNNPAEEAYYFKHGISYADTIVNQSEIDEMKLLLQFNSSEELDVMFGDMGSIYFYIEEENAQKLNFDEAWCVFQCY